MKRLYIVAILLVGSIIGAIVLPYITNPAKRQQPGEAKRATAVIEPVMASFESATGWQRTAVDEPVGRCTYDSWKTRLISCNYTTVYHYTFSGNAEAARQKLDATFKQADWRYISSTGYVSPDIVPGDKRSLAFSLNVDPEYSDTTANLVVYYDRYYQK